MHAFQTFSNCLLCDTYLRIEPSWQQLFTVEFSETLCNRCVKKFNKIEQEIDGVYCIYEYNEAMRDYFHRYKFMGDVYLAHVFRKELAAILKGSLNKTIILPIPMHEDNKKRRTFAQVDELLLAAHIPYNQFLRKLSKETQSSKTREERLAVENLFELIHSAQGNRFLLIDDVKTTGTTMRLAEKALLGGGAQEVKCVALAAAL